MHLDSRITLTERLEQLSPVLDQAGAVPGACVVGGDFNTSVLLWLGRLLPVPYLDQEIRIRRHFEAQGFQTPFVDGKATFDFLELRLDSIYAKGLGWTGWGVEDIKFSDHMALWIALQVEGAPAPTARQVGP